MRVRLLQLAASWTAIAIGIPLVLRAELGVAPADVLNTGVSGKTGWSFGLTFVVTGVVTFALGVALGGRLGWGSVAGSVVIGPLIELVLRQVPEYERLAVRIPLLLVGILIVALGICLAIKTAFGPGPTEVLMLGLVRRGLGVVSARWIGDGLPVVIGLLLGGELGPGTIVFVLAMGPLVKIGLRRLGFQPTSNLGERPLVAPASTVGQD